MDSYLNSCVKQFKYYKSLGDKALSQLEFEDLCYTPSEHVNSISIIVKHINGNMLSRWTNFLEEDGEKEWRDRDDEFVQSYKTKQELLTNWENSWNTLFSTFEALTDDDLNSTVYIRNQGHTVIEAINRQLCHYAYHIGQIVYMAKQIKGASFKSLSIPKGESENFNAEKFSKAKSRTHFTDDL